MSCSKSKLRFSNRKCHFDSDLELMSILVTAYRKGDFARNRDEQMFFYMPHGKYPVLEARRPTSQSRSIAVNHLCNSVNASYIKDIYEEFTEYLHGIIAEALKENPHNIERIISEHHVEMSASDIIKHHTNNTLVEHVAGMIFRALEREKSTINLIEKTRNKLGLDVDPPIINEALPFLEMRHVLVHSDGKPDIKFLQSYPDVPMKGDKIDLSYTLARKAGEKIAALVLAFDSDAISKGIIRDHLDA